MQTAHSSETLVPRYCTKLHGIRSQKTSHNIHRRKHLNYHECQ